MKKKYILLICICLIFLITLATSQKEDIDFISENLQNLEQVHISYVYDGDTIRISTGKRIRLIGVDTPEMNWEEGDPEFYAHEAYEYTKSHLLGQDVYLEFDEEKQDKYGRILAYLYLEDGTLFNEKLLKEGYATVMLIPPNLKYSAIFKEAEEEARHQRRGIWTEQIFISH